MQGCYVAGLRRCKVATGRELRESRLVFRTSTPVTAGAFHNRSRELAELERAVEQLKRGAPKWVAILGARKIGKTSLVLEAARRKAGTDLRVVTMDVQEAAPISIEVFRSMGLRVIDTVFGPELGESPEHLARRSAEYRALLQRSAGFTALPSQVRADVLEIVEGEATPARVAVWLQLPEQLAEARALRLAVALDEFQELAALESVRKGFDPFALMRSQWQKHTRGAFDLLATRGATQLGVQVKRSELPLRFSKVAWSRMAAEAERLGWHWVVVAVSVTGAIVVLDPDRASDGREVRLGEEAAIDNLVLWLDRRELRSASTRRQRPRSRRSAELP